MTRNLGALMCGWPLPAPRAVEPIPKTWTWDRCRR
jgi:hypothetical protein